MMLLSLYWMHGVSAESICSYNMARQIIDQGEDYLMRTCDVSGYVNLRWYVSEFKTLTSGEISLSAQFDNHGDLMYFDIDGETDNFEAPVGNPVDFDDGSFLHDPGAANSHAVRFRVYCRDDNERGVRR